MKDKKEEIYSTTTKDLATISSIGLVLTQLLTALIIIIGSYIYLAYLSLPIAIIVLSINFFSILVYYLIKKNNYGYIEKAREKEDKVFFYTREILDGFKEIKMNVKKGKEIIDKSLLDASQKSLNYSYKGYSNIYNINTLGQGVIYIIIIILLFISSISVSINSNILINCIIITLFLTGSLSSLSIIIPKIIEANVAALRLKNIIPQFYRNIKESNNINQFTEDLVFKNIEYTYGDINKELDNFKIGPFNMEIKKAKIIFIYGGNGAGKSSLFYLLMGLLDKQQGKIEIDGKDISSSRYNELFSPIFSDYHLFDKFYGLKKIDYNKMEYYLALFELNGKVSITEDSFSTTKLSSGQRKRLALIVEIMENRPVLMLDEWAADQDPYFRKKFYIEILPLLRELNITIVAITHDDSYYYIADTLYRMDYGKLIKIENGN